MVRATSAQAPEDLWHLSIDDLFASPAEPARGAVAGPYVINLSLSSAPSGAMPRGMPRFERLCVYQLKRALDKREDFRLRLGIIETELEADAILATVREYYPAARKETASSEDTTAVAARVTRAAKRVEQTKKAQPKPAAAVAAPRDVAPRAKTSPAPRAPAAPPPRWNVDDVLPQFAAHAPVKCEPVTRGPVPVVVAPKTVAPAAAAPAVVAPPVTQPIEFEFHQPAEPQIVALAVTPEPTPVSPVREDIASDSNAITLEAEALTFTIDAPVIAQEPPALELEVTIEVPHIPPAAVTEAAIREFVDTITMEVPSLKAPDAVVPRETTPPVAVAPVAVAPVAVPAWPVRSPDDSGSLERLVAKIDALVEELPAPPIAAPPAKTFAIDSTQTQRALTSLELSDKESSPWFVVQLILSEQEIDPEHVPSLDIFNEYRLYRVTGLNQERVMHALRLGFFSSEAAAQAVAGYLAVYFDSAVITRVSTAERERFAEDRLAARKDIGATGAHSVIELTSPTPLPERRAPETTTTPNDAGSARGQNSLWSRLVSSRKR